MFTIQDWRSANAKLVAAALHTETGRWRSDFAWDVTTTWQSIEPARTAGTLPGFVATDYAGRVVGWTCFLLHHGALQVAVFTAEAPEVTDRLMDAVLTSPEASAADLHVVCVRDSAPALRLALARRGFDTVTYRYLAAKPTATAPTASGDAVAPREWRTGDIDALADLCARAYPDTREVRAFAPLGTDAEWRDYVLGLVAGPGCGRLVPAATFVAEGRTRDSMDGAIVATDLGLGTGHIAQVVVDRAAEGRGLGTALVCRALSACHAQGFDRVTLLVSAANARAGRLYSRLGFRNRAAFVVAVNRQPRRFSSVALATGGVSTRRYAASVVSPRSSPATALRRASSASASADNDA